MSLHASAVSTLRAWTPGSASQAALRDAFLSHLADHTDGLSRACSPAHVTASAAVVDPRGARVLLVLHSKLGRWVQPGGHCESTDASLADAALREATEESGIDGLRLVPGILQADRHPAPCRPEDVEEHLDVRFLVVAPPGSKPVVDIGSDEARWFAWDALPPDIEPTIVDMIARARERLRLDDALAT